MNDPIRPRRTLPDNEPRCTGKRAQLPGSRQWGVEDECQDCLRRHAPVDFHTEYIQPPREEPCPMREAP